jgi:hypothetical protein
MTNLEEKINFIQGLGGEIQRNESLGRARHRWEDDNKIYLQQYVRVWTGHIWLRIQASDGLL